jgi:hypothetical protein
MSNPDLSDPFSWRLSLASGGAPVTGDRTSYAAWKSLHGVANDGVDVDGDGLLPVVEYALGSDPAAPSASSFQPVVTVQPGGSLHVQLTKALTADDAAVAFQLSANLTAWNPATATIVARSFGPGTETLTYSVVAAPGASRSFVRLVFSLR